MLKKLSPRSKTGLAVLIMFTLALVALFGLPGEQPLLAAGCCEDCDPAHQQCLDDCSFECGSDQTCYNSCRDVCVNQMISCFRHCVWCEYP